MYMVQSIGYTDGAFQVIDYRHGAIMVSVDLKYVGFGYEAKILTREDLYDVRSLSAGNVADCITRLFGQTNLKRYSGTMYEIIPCTPLSVVGGADLFRVQALANSVILEARCFGEREKRYLQVPVGAGQMFRYLASNVWFGYANVSHGLNDKFVVLIMCGSSVLYSLSVREGYATVLDGEDDMVRKNIEYKTSRELVLGR